MTDFPTAMLISFLVLSVLAFGAGEGMRYFINKREKSDAKKKLKPH